MRDQTGDRSIFVYETGQRKKRFQKSIETYIAKLKKDAMSKNS